jgi:hypothetical protein
VREERREERVVEEEDRREEGLRKAVVVVARPALAQTAKLTDRRMAAAEVGYSSCTKVREGREEGREERRVS